MVIAFQSIVALCAFVGLGGLLQYIRHEALVPVRTSGQRDDDGVRLGLVLRSNGQASGPN